MLLSLTFPNVEKFQKVRGRRGRKACLNLSFFLCLFVSYLSKMGVGKRHPHQIRIAHIKRWVEKKHDKTSSHIFTGVQNQEEIMEIHFLFSLPVTRGE